MLKAVLFDFDGTIVDTTELIHQSMRRATGEVLGRTLSREALLANVGQPLPRQMELLDPEGVEELLESYRLHNEELHEDLIGAFPNVETSLARLRDAGLRLAVVTSKRRFSLEMALDSFPALRDAVDAFVTMEDTTEHKPHPAPLLKALELLGDIPPYRAAYVGGCTPAGTGCAGSGLKRGRGSIRHKEPIGAKRTHARCSPARL